MRTVRARHHISDVLPPEVIAALNVPPLLPGEPLPTGTPLYAEVGPDVSLRVGGSLFRGPNGEPLDGDSHHQMLAMIAVRNAPGGELRSSFFYRSGVPIDVRTDYLGVDMGTGRGPLPLPLTWETMIFIGGEPGDCWRYTTRAAAHHGHRTIVAAVREQQRARRRADRTTAPRRARSVTS